MKQAFTAVLLISASALAVPEVSVLDNGLTVITEDMDYTRSVAVVIQYNVGSRNETDDIAGISHFTEHMLFNGTPGMPDTRLWQIVEKNGGYANGGTNEDCTTYFLQFPAARLSEALAIESDRMRNCGMDSAAVAEEIGVVLDEWRLGEDNPEWALWRRVGELMHPVHPYRRSVLGSGETITAFTRESVRDYYDTWYQPSNAVLVIAGDIDTGETLALVEEYFGAIPGAFVPGLELPADPPLNGPILDSFLFPVEGERLMIAFQGCDQLHPDAVALSFLSTYLSSGRTSWFENNLVLPGLASEAYAYSPGSIDPEAFTVYAALQDGADPDSVSQLILGEMHRLATDLLDQDTLDRIKQRYAARDVFSSDSPLDIAMRRAYSWGASGDPLHREKLLEAISALTAEEIRDAAQRYFTPERMVLVVMSPGGEAPASSADSDPHRELVPPDDMNWDGLVITEADLSVPDRSVSFGVTRFTLENGLTLLVKDDHSFPIVEIMFSFPMGDGRTTPDMAGLSALAAETMLGGTETLDRLAFHSRLEELGAGTWLNPNPSYTLGNTYGLSGDAGVLFASTADLLRRPAMREEDFLSARDRMVGMLRASLEQPMGRLFCESDLVIASEGTASIVTETTLASISIDDVKNFHALCARPSETVIAVVGDITPEQALFEVERHFADWTEPDGQLPALSEYQFRPVPGDTMVASIPGRIQAATTVMCPAPGLDSPDEPAFNMAVRILGAGISSRLGRYIREQQGLAYSVWAYSDAGSTGFRNTAMFRAVYSTGASMNTRALRSTVNECERIASEGVEPMELLIEQSRAVGSQALGFDTYGDLAQYLVEMEASGLPLDRDIRRLEQITALTADQVRDAAARYFTGDWFVYSAGGVGEELEPLE